MFRPEEDPTSDSRWLEGCVRILAMSSNVVNCFQMFSTSYCRLDAMCTTETQCAIVTLYIITKTPSNFHVCSIMLEARQQLKEAARCYGEGCDAGSVSHYFVKVADWRCFVSDMQSNSGGAALSVTPHPTVVELLCQ